MLTDDNILREIFEEMTNLRGEIAAMRDTLGAILVVMRSQAEHLVSIDIRLRRLEEVWCSQPGRDFNADNDADTETGAN
jgi:hypothetical protein